MNIRFDDAVMQNRNSFINVTGNTTSNSTYFTENSGNKISLDITNKVTDNNAYKGQGKTNKDVMMNAAMENMTLDAQRDYMAVMSNCVSAEDFQKMQKDGFKPGDMDIKESVTIVDHIKAAIMKGGANVIGYTDNISKEALKEITGNEAYARKLEQDFAGKDIPFTKENVEAIIDGYDELSKIGELSEAGIKYLVENDLEPSVDNLYKANYASGNDANMQGRGYYQADIKGYYAKKSDSLDVSALKNQIQGIIEEAGYEATDENVSGGIWLIEKGIPLNTDTFRRYKNITELSLPMDFNKFSSVATDAIFDGIKVNSKDLSESKSMRQSAYDINSEVQDFGSIKGRRVLEEVRLSMTTEANLKLLRSGYQIDTAPMEDLVKNLKEIEKEFAINLTGDSNEIEAIRKKDIYEDTISTVDYIRTSPIQISYRFEAGFSLSQVRSDAQILRNEYEKANQSYEALMTAPRGDLGDSISKAFRNVDDILNDMNLPITMENQRAVRILGYNRIDITEENILSVKEKDNLLTQTIELMTPGRVLGMIRDDKNPLLMSVEELNQYLKKQDDPKEDIESFSKFLYKLEKTDDITKEERSAFIGIYRLINQIEKSDYSSIGAIEATQSNFNFENILKGLRSRKHKAMDYKIDDKFGGIDAIDKGIESISSQIDKGYVKDVADLKELLAKTLNEKADEEYESQQAEEYRNILKTETDILSQLNNMNTPITPNNIEDMKLMMKEPSSVFKKLKDIGYKRKNDINLDSKEAAKAGYEEFTEDVKEFINKKVFEHTENDMALRSMDLNALGKIYQHMDFLNNQAKEENYQIPVLINGEITGINLKVIHSKKDSKVGISFDNDTFGKVTAQFEFNDKGLSGICNCTSDNTILALDNNLQSLKDSFADENLKVDSINFVNSKNINIESFNSKITQDRTSDTDVVSNEQLYKAAKLFIEYVRDVAV